jgi:hypothetical protein
MPPPSCECERRLSWETASKTDVTILSWGQKASSAPWSSTPSLQRSINMAISLLWSVQLWIVLSLASKYVQRTDEGAPVYELFAVSNHFGGMGGGHYTAYAKQTDDGRWWCFDDSRWKIPSFDSPNSCDVSRGCTSQRSYRCPASLERV